jgi:protein-S-isoprenylcysteine O-methyltransferase Ste14
MRREADGAYVVPRGILFRRVSCPNYLGELIQWCGWAVATWSLAGLTFAVWTAANLVPRAHAHHRWYRERFPDYPPERRALLPF